MNRGSMNSRKRTGKAENRGSVVLHFPVLLVNSAYLEYMSHARPGLSTLKDSIFPLS